MSDIVSKIMKILISGGHLTPALAFIDYATKQGKDECIFVGRHYTQADRGQKSHEEDEVRSRNVRFIPFDSGKFSASSPLQLFTLSFRLPIAVLKSLEIFGREKPDIFLSFGGYLALPLAFAAFLRGTPIVTHEQTHVVGIANKLIAKIATAVAVGYKDTLLLFPAKKTVWVGNPLRRNILNPHPQTPKWTINYGAKPILYITGGSQGSQFINMLVLQTLPQLTQEWYVVHQCGSPTKTMKYKEELEKRKKTLPASQQKYYFVSEWFTEEEQAWLYRNASAILSRAGANTVQEILAFGKPAIFIPLPHAHDDEQLRNAQVVVDAGAGMVIAQKNINASTFLLVLAQFKRRYQTLRKNARQHQKEYDIHADQRLYDLVKQVWQTRTR